MIFQYRMCVLFGMRVFVSSPPAALECVHSVCFSVIHDAREWRYFKMLNDVTTPVEEQLFNTGTTSNQPQIFLRPKETVHVPFRFLTFRADHSVPDQAPSDPYRPFSQTAALMSHKKNVIEQLESRSIKVIARLLIRDT